MYQKITPQCIIDRIKNTISYSKKQRIKITTIKIPSFEFNIISKYLGPELLEVDEFIFLGVKLKRKEDVM